MKPGAVAQVATGDGAGPPNLHSGEVGGIPDSGSGVKGMTGACPPQLSADIRQCALPYSPSGYVAVAEEARKEC
ncbi:hypothetical protein MSA03_26680 [Microbacterium saccharophilum]|nr:hypothetical protein MSA03_26680 [Microbacterium saccharophilum]